MRALFRAFKRARVRTLVISGQAGVLYGATHFTQDLDLWIEPTGANLRRVVAALARLRARVYKLTPPLEISFLRRGHGFHFLVPQAGGPPLYLDLMGRPPRVGSFAAAYRRRERIRTPWGELPVVSIEDLVEIKKTNRPDDYEVIGRLALIRLARERRARPALVRWALENIFRAEDLWEAVERHGAALKGRGFPAAARPFLAPLRRGRAPTLRELAAASRAAALQAARLQARGRAYWLPRLAELRRLRASGRLLPEGAAV